MVSESELGFGVIFGEVGVKVKNIYLDMNNGVWYEKVRILTFW